ncbi:MAG: hypothetical protein ACHQUC_08995, partial [Chlamydiales bacterium]
PKACFLFQDLVVFLEKEGINSGNRPGPQKDQLKIKLLDILTGQQIAEHVLEVERSQFRFDEWHMEKGEILVIGRPFDAPQHIKYPYCEVDLHRMTKPVILKRRFRQASDISGRVAYIKGQHLSDDHPNNWVSCIVVKDQTRSVEKSPDPLHQKHLENKNRIRQEIERRVLQAKLKRLTFISVIIVMLVAIVWGVKANLEDHV